MISDMVKCKSGVWQRNETTKMCDLVKRSLGKGTKFLRERECNSFLLTSCPSSGRASSTFFALFSSLTGSRDLRNLAGWGERTLKGLELKNVGLSGTKPAREHLVVVMFLAVAQCSCYSCAVSVVYLDFPCFWWVWCNASPPGDCSWCCPHDHSDPGQ